MADELCALSLKQPWAALLAGGGKTIEIRRWKTQRRGLVLIHASKQQDTRPEAWRGVTPELRPLTELRGGIIGSAELIDCRPYPTAAAFLADLAAHRNDPTWFQTGLYGFVFANPRLLPFRKYPGDLRFFTIREEA